MDIHLDLDRRAPLRAQLERELRQAIRSGRLRAGTKLPSSRLLADEFRVSRGVVVEAYSQLVAEGYLATRSGGGTRVADGLALQPPAARVPDAPLQRVRYDLRSGVPDLSFFPRREWQSASAAALRELPDAALGYGSRRGHRRLRVALSDYLGRVRAVVAEPERVFITAGATVAMGLLWRTLRERGAKRIARDEARRAQVASPLGEALRVEGIITGGERGIAHLWRAVAVLGPSPARLEFARALVELGGALRRSGKRAAARAPLRRGLELADGFGARPLAETALAELRASGARPRRAALSGIDALTPTERRIAELAAAGRANPQIAKALYVTTKTVDWHLSHVYSKLDITSRDRLPVALRGVRAQNPRELTG
jgi:DNA-binding CsgD family transcriptional regulator